MIGAVFGSPGLVALSALLLGGLVLLIRGLLGRRVGDEPRCRKCDYNLTGLEAENCPECGTPASGKNVVIGRRRRRRPSLILGAVLALVSGTGLGMLAYGRARNVNWYRYYPKFVLVSEARADERQALEELARRVTNGELAAAEVAELIPQALDRQGADPPGPAMWWWTNLLASLERRGGLTQEQRERFYRQIVSVSMEFRSRIRQGERFRFVRSYWIRQMAALNGTYEIEGGELRIGPDWRTKFEAPASGSLSGPGCGGGNGRELSLGELSPGVYPVEYDLRKSIFLGGTDPDRGQPFVSEELMLTGELEILPRDAPDPLQLIDDPDLGEAFKSVITVFIPPPGEGPGVSSDRELEIAVKVEGRVPVGAAFEVVALVGDKEVKVGSLELTKARSHSSTRYWTVDKADLDCKRFIPILRTSAKVARDTPNLFEIWNGEIRFDPVEIE